MFRITKKAKILLTVCMVALLALTACSGSSKTTKSSGKAQKANPASDFEYDFNEDGKSLHIRKFIGKGSDVVFPAEIEGYPVTEIGHYKPVFELDGYSNKHENLRKNNAKVNLSVKSVVIPEGIEFITGGAFERCEGLKSVTLPNTLKEIWPMAFMYSSVEKIIIPDSVEYIGEFAFQNCKDLKEVVLPESLAILSQYTFSYCNSLTDVNIPAGIKKIDSNVFSDCPLTNLKIPESIESVMFVKDEFYKDIPYPDNSAFFGSQPPLAIRKRLQDLGYGGTF